MKPRVVIIGGGFGGLSAAQALRDAEMQITLLDRNNHHLFQPLLYQVAMAGLAAPDIAAPIRSILRHQANAEVLLTQVQSIDLARKQVITAEDALSFDYLIYAAGAKTHYYGREEWAEHALGLKNIDDALDIRRRVLSAFEQAERTHDPLLRQALLTFVIIGGGPTGVELAGALAELSQHILACDFRSLTQQDTRIVLLEGGARILGSFHPDLAHDARLSLTRMGVEVITEAQVTDVTGAGVTYRMSSAPAGHLPDQTHPAPHITLPSRTILWGAGVRATALTQTLGVPLDRLGRIITTPDLSLPGHPYAFAIGDAAAFLHQGKSALPGVAQVAIQQGKQAAYNVMQHLSGQASERFYYKDKGNLATIGRKSAVAEIGRIKLSGGVAWLMWSFVHVLFLVGYKNRIAVMLQWIWSYFTYQRGARLIVGRDAPQAQTLSQTHTHTQTKEP